MSKNQTEQELQAYDEELAALNRALNTNLEHRKALANESVQRLYSRRALEQGFLECFELVGGIPRLAIWANNPENYGEFLKLLMKFAPKETAQEVGRVLEYRSNVPGSPLNRGEVLEVQDHDSEA